MTVDIEAKLSRNLDTIRKDLALLLAIPDVLSSPNPTYGIKVNLEEESLVQDYRDFLKLMNTMSHYDKSGMKPLLEISFMVNYGHFEMDEDIAVHWGGLIHELSWACSNGAANDYDTPLECAGILNDFINTLSFRKEVDGKIDPLVVLDFIPFKRVFVRDCISRNTIGGSTYDNIVLLVERDTSRAKLSGYRGISWRIGEKANGINNK